VFERGMRLSDYVTLSLVFGQLEGSRFFVALGCWVLTNWLTCTSCVGCCNLVFPIFWQVSGIHGVAGALFE
jgi:hypothetical protein